MKTCKTKKLGASLTKKGFKLQETHHTMYWLHIGDKRSSVRTRISHGKKEYSVGLLREMARQLGLEPAEFEDLIECPMSAERYLELLVERGHVTLPTVD